MYTTLKEVLQEADALNMAVGAFNTHNLEMLPAIIKAAVKQKHQSLSRQAVEPQIMWVTEIWLLSAAPWQRNTE